MQKRTKNIYQQIHKMTIQDLKSRIDIYVIAEKLGIVINSSDKACCPFHNDKTPSLQFSRKKQIATCFSSNCDAGTMDVVNLTQKKLNLSTHEALQWLKEQIGIYDMPKAETTITVSQTERIEILTNLYEKFERGFLSSKPARDYLDSRNIKHKTLSVGFNTGTFHHSVNLKENRAETLKQYVALGLLKEHQNGFTIFGKGCLVFPLKNEQGQIVSFYYREINETKKVKHYYLKDRQGLYSINIQPTTQKIILTESVIDAITLSQNTKNLSVLANYGTEGSAEQIEVIKSLQDLKEVTLFFDGDTPGIKGAEKLAKTLFDANNNLIINIVQTPQNEDINSLLEGHSPKILTQLIQEAEPFTQQNHIFSFHPASNRETEKRTPNTELQTLKTSNPNNLILVTEIAIYHIKGGVRKDLDSLKVSLQIQHPSTLKWSRTKLDLYEDKQTEKFARDTASKLDLRSDLVERDLSILTDLLDEYRTTLTTSIQDKTSKQEVLTASEKQEYIQFGKSKDLLNKISELIGKSGVVGEERNRLFLFCGAVSHLMPKPINIVVQGSSGSGKSFLIKKISHLVPQSKVRRYTRLSEKSFYNFGEFDLCNTLIIVEDYDGMNEEVEYAFREIQSNGELISAISSKENENADIQTKDKIVRGPIASMVATTKGEIYHDNSTRVFFISVDESKEQTQRIITYKSQRASGIIQETDEENAKNYLQKFVQTLQPLKVQNPYLSKIKLPVSHDQLRRLHELLESFCEQITLLHQHNRKRTQNHRIITEKEDMQLAIDLLFDSILLKADELDGSLRGFYEQLKTYVKSKSEEYEFTRREIRHQTKVSNTQLHRFMKQLQDLEYITYSGGYSNKGHHYKIVYWDDNEKLRKQIKADLNQQLQNL